MKSALTLGLSVGNLLPVCRGKSASICREELCPSTECPRVKDVLKSVEFLSEASASVCGSSGLSILFQFIVSGLDT